MLFLDRARSARPGFELTERSTTTVGELCGRLDGLPLAIELAAARVDLLSPAAILTRLDHQLDLLADDRAGQPARHRSLRAAIDTSYDLLGQREQDVFCDLSVFAGGFTVATAEQFVSAGHPLLVDVVRTLLRASLLHPAGTPGDEPRFEMLQTVRTYSRDQLERTGRSVNLHDAHASAYRALAEEAEPQLRGPDQARWLDLVEAELPNIRQALQWAVRNGNVDTGLYTAAGLWRFWQVRGHTHEARRHLEAMLAEPSGSTEARATGNLAVAQCAFAQGDHEPCRSTWPLPWRSTAASATPARSPSVWYCWAPQPAAPATPTTASPSCMRPWTWPPRSATTGWAPCAWATWG